MQGTPRHTLAYTARLDGIFGLYRPRWVTQSPQGWKAYWLSVASRWRGEISSRKKGGSKWRVMEARSFHQAAIELAAGDPIPPMLCRGNCESRKTHLESWGPQYLETLGHSQHNQWRYPSLYA